MKTVKTVPVELPQTVDLDVLRVPETPKPEPKPMFCPGLSEKGDLAYVQGEAVSSCEALQTEMAQ